MIIAQRTQQNSVFRSVKVSEIICHGGKRLVQVLLLNELVDHNRRRSSFVRAKLAAYLDDVTAVSCTDSTANTDIVVSEN